MSNIEFPFNPADIKTPCEADWETMRGDDAIRFCEHCQLSVRDISGITNKDLRRLVRNARGRLCVRYAPRKPKVDPPPPLHQIRRYAGRAAAGAFGATLGLSSVWAYQKAGRMNEFPLFVINSHQGDDEPVPASEMGSLSGKVTHEQWQGENKKPSVEQVSHAKITLTEQRTRNSFVEFTGNDGSYELKNIPAGVYRILIEATGYESFTAHDLTIEPSRRIQKDATLEPDRSGWNGAFRIAYSTPLLEAIGFSEYDKIQELLVNGADVNEKDKRLEVTALHLAVERSNKELVELLLRYGANPNLLDRSGQNALMQVGWWQQEKTKEEIAAIIRQLVAAGADINAQDDDGDTALLEAVKSKDLAALKALLGAGANPDLQNENGETALILAAKNGFKKMTEQLLAAGANTQVRDECGQSALMYATAKDHQDVAALLQNHGASE